MIIAPGLNCFKRLLKFWTFIASTFSTRPYQAPTMKTQQDRQLLWQNFHFLSWLKVTKLTLSFLIEAIDSIQFWDMKVKQSKGIENKGPGRALLTLPGRPSPPLTTFHNCPRRDGIEKLETGFRLSPMENKYPKLNWMEHFFGFQFLTTSFPYWQVVVLSRFDFTGKPWDDMYIFLVSTNTSLS